MEWYHVGVGLLALLVLFIGIGLSIPFALAAASLPFLFYIQGWSTALVSSELKLWGVWIDYVLLAVPLFVFLGELIGRSNIGPNLYQFMHRGVRVRGSAAYGSIAACAGFGAVCGSSMVGSLTIGGVALPEMKKLGYDNRLSSGVLAAGGTLSVLIPPSLILLFYGIVTDTSIGELFIAGMVPGLVLVLLFCVMTYYRVPQQFTELFMSYQLSPYAVLAMVLVFYIMLGVFLEPVSMTFITLPTIFPLMQAAGFDMIWLGIVYTITMEIAVLTPPVGLNLYVIQGISRGSISIGEVIVGCLPFIASMLVLIALLLVVPGTATWLPAAMK